MKDLITRWDATEVVYKALRTPTPDYKKDPFHDSYSLAISMVRQIPSAQQWLSVSERLPEKKDEVLVTTSWGDVCMAWCDNGKWRAEYINEYDDDEIVAWMPLPEPYASQKEDEKMGVIFIDYAKAKECINAEAWFSCDKCGQCGRRFKDGFMVDEGGTTPVDLSEE